MRQLLDFAFEGPWLLIASSYDGNTFWRSILEEGHIMSKPLLTDIKIIGQSLSSSGVEILLNKNIR
jgi:hypothetical protein